MLAIIKKNGFHCKKLSGENTIFYFCNVFTYQWHNLIKFLLKNHKEYYK